MLETETNKLDQAFNLDTVELKPTPPIEIDIAYIAFEPETIEGIFRQSFSTAERHKAIRKRWEAGKGSLLGYAKVVTSGLNAVTESVAAPESNDRVVRPAGSKAGKAESNSTDHCLRRASVSGKVRTP